MGFFLLQDKAETNNSVRFDSLAKAHLISLPAVFSLIPALVMVFHRTVKFKKIIEKGNLPSWDGLRQEHTTPSDGARKGNGERTEEQVIWTGMGPSGASYG